MLMIWRGRGFIVPLAVIALVLAADGSSTTSRITASIVIAVAVWVIGQKFENGGGSDHFWFIPVKFWGPIILVIGCLMGAGKGAAVPVPPASAPPEPAREATVQPPPVREYVPAYQATHAPRETYQPASSDPPASEFPKIAQVYVDNTTHLYYLEKCTRPDKAYRIPRSLALQQGFRLASGCSAS